MYRNDPDVTNRTRLALVIAFIAATLIFIADQSDNRILQRSKSLSNNSVSPILTLLSSPMRATEGFFVGLQDRRRALAENEALKQELYQLREIKNRAEIMEMKLSRFEQLLKARAGIDIPDEKIAARAVSEADGPFVRAALINVGTSKGVAVGHSVMSVDGMYGHIVRVGSNSSRVLRLSDLNSRIAIMSDDGIGTAILVGNNTDFPEVSFMSDVSDWKTGQSVMTSGDDGVLPRGLPIGQVIKGPNNNLAVDLYVNKSPVDWVWVYPYDPIPVPESDEESTDVLSSVEDESSLIDEVNVPKPEGQE